MLFRDRPSPQGVGARKVCIMRTILTTVGTSLLGNYRRERKEESPTEDQLFFCLRETPPEAASAETNSLSRLLQEGDRIVFLHSQTGEGKRCAQALRRHYESRGWTAEAQEVSDLDYAESRFKIRGLRALVATLISRLLDERKQGRRVLINATGGFKAEIAYATVVGLLFDAPVYYIHEAFRDIIEMPPMPIGWDYSLLADHEEFFEWVCESDRTTVEVDARLQDLPAEVRLLLAEEGGVTQLSPAGYAFYEAFEIESGPAPPSRYCCPPWPPGLMRRRTRRSGNCGTGRSRNSVSASYGSRTPSGWKMASVSCTRKGADPNGCCLPNPATAGCWSWSWPDTATRVTSG